MVKVVPAMTALLDVPLLTTSNFATALQVVAFAHELKHNKVESKTHWPISCLNLYICHLSVDTHSTQATMSLQLF